MPEFGSSQVAFLETAVPRWQRASREAVESGDSGYGGLNDVEVDVFAREVEKQLGVSFEVGRVLVRGLEGEPMTDDVVSQARELIELATRTDGANL